MLELIYIFFDMASNRHSIVKTYGVVLLHVCCFVVFMLWFLLYVGRSLSKVSYFFFSGMEADRNVKVVGGDVAVL